MELLGELATKGQHTLGLQCEALSGNTERVERRKLLGGNVMLHIAVLSRNCKKSVQYCGVRVSS